MKVKYLVLLFILIIASCDSSFENITGKAVEVDSCGNVTQDIILTSDITSHGDCFTVKADNVIIDGNGHTISNTKSTIETGEHYPRGVSAIGYNGVTVKNFAGINSFGVAVLLTDSNDSKVLNNEIIASDNFRIGGKGIFLYESSNNIVEGNTITTTTGTEGHGIQVKSFDDFVDNNQIIGNTITTHGWGTYGIILDRARYTKVDSNDITCYGDRCEGITNWNGKETVITSNKINIEGNGVLYYYGGFGIRLAKWPAKEISNNIITTSGSRDAGIYIFKVFDIDEFSNTVFNSNEITISGPRSVGIFLEDAAFLHFNNDIVNNLNGDEVRVEINNEGTIYNNSDNTMMNVLLDNVKFSATSLWKVNIDVPSAPPSNTKQNVGGYVDVDNVSGDSYIEFSIGYEDSDLTGINETILRMYRYDGSTWNLVESSSVDTANNKVESGYVDEFGVFGIFEDKVEDEDVASCISDSDGGNDYYKKGTVTTDSETYSDYCMPWGGGDYWVDGEQRMVEYSCENNILKEEIFTCPRSQTSGDFRGCSDGACVAENVTNRRGQWKCFDGSLGSAGGEYECHPASYFAQLAHDSCQDKCDSEGNCGVLYVNQWIPCGEGISECIDSDESWGEYQKFVKGSTNVNTDKCVGGDSWYNGTDVNEGTCVGEVRETVLLECPNGCTDGTCIRVCEESDLYITKYNYGNPSWSGWNYGEKGVACGQTPDGTPVMGVDYCINENEIKEFQCNAYGQVSERIRLCDDIIPGTKCYDGACRETSVASEPEPCTDTEDDINYYTKGTVSGSCGSFTEVCNQDKDSDTLVNTLQPATAVLEYWCEDEIVFNEWYNCPNGCEDGACIEDEDTPPDDVDECTDTDGGIDYYVKGKVTLSGEEFSDDCVFDEVAEFYCDDNALGVKNFECSKGCEDGACLEDAEELPCPNNICEEGESCSSCPSDCGECSDDDIEIPPGTTPVEGELCTPSKTLICHITNSGSEVNLCVDNSAVESLLQQGDYLGKCVKEKRIKKQLTQIKPKEAQDIEVVLEKSSVHGLSVEFNEDISEAEMTFRSREIAPQEVVQPKSPVKDYFIVDHPNVEQEKIQKAQFKFRLEKEWVKQNTDDLDEVVLTKYINNEWVDLPTRLVKEDSKYYYFEADSDGLSVFAVTIKKDEEQDQEPNVQPEVEEDVIPSSEDEPVYDYTDDKTDNTLFIVIATISTILAIILFVAKPSKKKDQKEKNLDPYEKKYGNLIEFVKNSRKKGKTEEQIKEELKEADWNSDVIEKVMSDKYK